MVPISQGSTPSQNARSCRYKAHAAGTSNSTNVRLARQKLQLFQWRAVPLWFPADEDSLPTDSGHSVRVLLDRADPSSPALGGAARLRLLDPIEFGEAGDDIAQPGWPVAVQSPRPSPDLDGFFILPQLVIGAGQSGQPNGQARIGGAQANSLLGQFDRLVRPSAIKVHLAKQHMGGGKAGIELDRLLEC